MMLSLCNDFLDETNIAEGMGMMEQEFHEATTNIPFVSQIKSAIQAINGNTIEARETQDKFSKRFPIVSQARSLVEVIQGRPDVARETQTEFMENIRNTFRLKHIGATVLSNNNDKDYRTGSNPFKIVSKSSGKALNNFLCLVENKSLVDLLWYEQDGFIYNNDRSAVLDISAFSSAKAFLSSKMKVIMYSKKNSDNINQQWIIGANGLIKSKARGFFLKEDNDMVYISSSQPHTFWIISVVSAEEKISILKASNQSVVEKQDSGKIHNDLSPVATENSDKKPSSINQGKEVLLLRSPETNISIQEQTSNHELDFESKKESGKNSDESQILKSSSEEKRYPAGSFLMIQKGKCLTRNLELIDSHDESQGILWRDNDGFIENLDNSKVLDICEYSKLKGVVQSKFKVILYSRKLDQNHNQKWVLREDGVIESRVGKFYLRYDGGQLLASKDKADKWEVLFK